MKKMQGFTLIELLIVIAIIAILASLIVIRIGNASQDAMRARRSADMETIHKAIEIYVAKGGVVVTDRPSAMLLKSYVNDDPTFNSKIFSRRDSAGNFPNNYINQTWSGDEYPVDPDSTESVYYAYSVSTNSAGRYTISAHSQKDPTLSITY